MSGVSACVCIATPMDDGTGLSVVIPKCALLTERMEIDVLLIFVARERVFGFFVSCGWLFASFVPGATTADGNGANLFRI